MLQSLFLLAISSTTATQLRGSHGGHEVTFSAKCSSGMICSGGHAGNPGGCKPAEPFIIGLYGDFDFRKGNVRVTGDPLSMFQSEDLSGKWKGNPTNYYSGSHQRADGATSVVLQIGPTHWKGTYNYVSGAVGLNQHNCSFSGPSPSFSGSRTAIQLRGSNDIAAHNQRNGSSLVSSSLVGNGTSIYCCCAPDHNPFWNVSSKCSCSGKCITDRGCPFCPNPVPSSKATFEGRCDAVRECDSRKAKCTLGQSKKINFTIFDRSIISPLHGLSEVNVQGLPCSPQVDPADCSNFEGEWLDTEQNKWQGGMHRVFTAYTIDEVATQSVEFTLTTSYPNSTISVMDTGSAVGTFKVSRSYHGAAALYTLSYSCILSGEQVPVMV